MCFPVIKITRNNAGPTSNSDPSGQSLPATARVAAKMIPASSVTLSSNPKGGSMVVIYPAPQHNQPVLDMSKQYYYPTVHDRRPDNRLPAGYYREKAEDRPTIAKEDVAELTISKNRIQRLLTPDDWKKSLKNSSKAEREAKTSIKQWSQEVSGNGWGETDKKGDWKANSNAGWGNDAGNANGWGEDKAKSDKGWGEVGNDNVGDGWGDSKSVKSSKSKKSHLNVGWGDETAQSEKTKHSKKSKKGKKGSKSKKDDDGWGNDNNDAGGGGGGGWADGNNNDTNDAGGWGDTNDNNNNNGWDNKSNKSKKSDSGGWAASQIGGGGSGWANDPIPVPLSSDVSGIWIPAVKPGVPYASSRNKADDNESNITVRYRAPTIRSIPTFSGSSTGCSCSRPSSSSSSTCRSCPTCYIRRQMPKTRDFVQDTKGKWYQAVSESAYNKSGEFIRGSDGRLYRELDPKISTDWKAGKKEIKPEEGSESNTLWHPSTYYSLGHPVAPRSIMSRYMPMKAIDTTSGHENGITKEPWVIGDRVYSVNTSTIPHKTLSAAHLPHTNQIMTKADKAEATANDYRKDVYSGGMSSERLRSLYMPKGG